MPSGNGWTVNRWRRTGVMAACLLVPMITAAACSPGDERAPTSVTDGAPQPTAPDPSDLTSAPGSTVDASVPVPTFVDENGFDDHTVPSVDSIEELMALSRRGVGGQSSVKFTLPQFDRPVGAPDLARAHLMDSNFYGLHDEWYFFRLLNGQSVPGAPATPSHERRFADVGDIQRWAAALPPDELPLGLTYVGDRLYAADFYDLALHGDPRVLGVGSLVRFPDPTAGRPDHWLIELEYSDSLTPAIVAQFFARLEPVLPAEVAGSLEWVIRSPQHELVAQAMIDGQLPFHDRVVHYRDLVSPGTVAVYSEGVTAGRLLYVGDGGAELSDARAGDIVITRHVPDWLPQASALITSDPQTPLAHVNLLARNRGIPNASQAGIDDDAGVRQAARVRAHAIVITDGSSLTIALITREQYAAWTARQRPSAVSVPLVDISTMPLLVHLDDLVAELSADGPDGRGLTEDEVAAWRPVIGGKSAGFLTLLAAPRSAGLTPPPEPLAITVRPYIEHIDSIRDTIAHAVSDPSVVGSQRALWLTLEGPDEFADVFPSEADAEFAAGFVAAHPPGTPLGDVLAAGGVRALIESKPVAPVTLAAIVDELARTYADYDVSTGLRFRSSSSVEDIEGFNGAGLYTSYTGYLQPAALADPDDRDNTIERALLRAWSSYWSFEAFEERRLAQVDHISGAMGLTVHARFDDELEANNGVVTFTFLPGGEPDDAEIEINVQAGSVEVTNPDTDEVEFPEVIRVTRRAGTTSIERVAGSTVLDEGEQVMDDVAITELVEQTAAVARVWRERLNASLPPAQRVQTVVLDYEFKTMRAGWPRLRDDAAPYPARLVVRQVRSLDPGLRSLPDQARGLPVPRDVLMRASSVITVSCTAADETSTTHVEVLTDPLSSPDMGHDEQPLVVGPAPAPGSACTRTTLFASPRRSLIDLVDDGGAFVIIG